MNAANENAGDLPEDAEPGVATLEEGAADAGAEHGHEEHEEHAHEPRSLEDIDAYWNQRKPFHSEGSESVLNRRDFVKVGGAMGMGAGLYSLLNQSANGIRQGMHSEIDSKIDDPEEAKAFHDTVNGLSDKALEEAHHHIPNPTMVDAAGAGVFGVGLYQIISAGDLTSGTYAGMILCLTWKYLQSDAAGRKHIRDELKMNAVLIPSIMLLVNWGEKTDLETDLLRDKVEKALTPDPGSDAESVGIRVARRGQAIVPRLQAMHERIFSSLSTGSFKFSGAPGWNIKDTSSKVIAKPLHKNVEDIFSEVFKDGVQHQLSEIEDASEQKDFIRAADAYLKKEILPMITRKRRADAKEAALTGKPQPELTLEYASKWYQQYGAEVMDQFTSRFNDAETVHNTNITAATMITSGASISPVNTTIVTAKVFNENGMAKELESGFASGDAPDEVMFGDFQAPAFDHRIRKLWSSFGANWSGLGGVGDPPFLAMVKEFGFKGFAAQYVTSLIPTAGFAVDTYASIMIEHCPYLSTGEAYGTATKQLAKLMPLYASQVWSNGLNLLLSLVQTAFDLGDIATLRLLTKNKYIDMIAKLPGKSMLSKGAKMRISDSIQGIIKKFFTIDIQTGDLSEMQSFAEELSTELDKAFEKSARDMGIDPEAHRPGTDEESESDSAEVAADPAAVKSAMSGTVFDTSMSVESFVNEPATGAVADAVTPSQPVSNVYLGSVEVYGDGIAEVEIEPSMANALNASAGEDSLNGEAFTPDTSQDPAEEGVYPGLRGHVAELYHMINEADGDSVAQHTDQADRARRKAQTVASSAAVVQAKGILSQLNTAFDELDTFDPNTLSAHQEEMIANYCGDRVQQLETDVMQIRVNLSQVEKRRLRGEIKDRIAANEEHLKLTLALQEKRSALKKAKNMRPNMRKWAREERYEGKVHRGGIRTMGSELCLRAREDKIRNLLARAVHLIEVGRLFDDNKKLRSHFISFIMEGRQNISRNRLQHQGIWPDLRANREYKESKPDDKPVDKFTNAALEHGCSAGHMIKRLGTMFDPKVMEENLGHTNKEVARILTFQAHCVPFLVPIFNLGLQALPKKSPWYEMGLYAGTFLFSGVADNLVAAMVGLQLDKSKWMYVIPAAIHGGPATQIANMANHSANTLNEMPLALSACMYFMRRNIIRGLALFGYSWAVESVTKIFDIQLEEHMKKHGHTHADVQEASRRMEEDPDSFGDLTGSFDDYVGKDKEKGFDTQKSNEQDQELFAKYGAGWLGQLVS